MNPSVLLTVAGSVILLLSGEADALFGFRRASEEVTAKAKAVAIIRESVAADDFVSPAVGVGRQDGPRFTAARMAGELACGATGGPAFVVPWERVNDDFCDCPDGSDEPGTSACAKGECGLGSASGIVSRCTPITRERKNFRERLLAVICSACLAGLLCQVA